MSNQDLLRRLILLKRNPNLANVLPQGEILQYIETLLTAFEGLKKAIETNKIKGEDGYSPVKGKDYAAKEDTEAMVRSILQQGLNEYSSIADALIEKVENRLAEIKDGDDGEDAEITDELKEEIAEMCRGLIALPDFDALVEERLTANPTAVRDALELIDEEDEKLSIDAVGHLREELDKILQEALIKVNGGGGVSRNTVIDLIAQYGGTGGGHVIQDEGTPLTQRTNLNFVGAGVTVTDDAGNDATVVTVTTGSATPGGSDTQVQFNDGGSFGGDAGLTYDKTLNTLTAGSFSGGASALTSLNINGTNGNGHIHLKHQASDPSSQASASTIFADANGNLAWINDGLSKITVDGDGVTAARTYTLPDASGTVALTSDLHAAATVTDSTSIDLTITGQDITAQREALTGAITAPKNSNTTSLGSFTKSQLSTAVSDGDVLFVGDVTSNATHTGEVTGSGALTVDKTAISNRTDTPITASDYIIFGDASDTDNLKKDTVQGILDLVTGGSNTYFNDIYIDQSGGTSDTYGALTGTINGSNALFTVSQAAYATGTLQVWLNGQLMTQGSSEDYVETTPASGTFTFNTAPATGSEITVAYQKVVTNSSTVVTTSTVTELAQDAVGTILTDSAEIDFTYNDATPSITASIVAGSIDEAKLDTSVNASLDLADSSLQPAAIGTTVQGYSAVLAATTASFTTADETKLDGIEALADVTDATNVAAAGAFMKSVDDTDDITEGTTNKFATAAEKTKLGHITVTQAVDLDALETASHAAVTVADSAEIDLTLTGQQISASIVAGSIDETKLDASVNASLDLADNSVQKVASTDNALVRFDSTGGVVQNGTLSASDVSAGVVELATIGNNDLVLKTGNATTGSITIPDGANADITIAPNGSGDVVIDGTLNLAANFAEVQLSGGTGILDTNSNYLLIFQETTSAVNQLQITNAATGNAPSIAATGSNANINIALTPKGSGVVAVATDLTVADEAYDATAWNGSLEVPTKNAIRDKIESMSAGSGLDHGQVLRRISLAF